MELDSWMKVHFDGETKSAEAYLLLRDIKSYVRDFSTNWAIKGH